MDCTEGIRKELTHIINSEIESNDEKEERKRLETIHGKVWDTEQVRNEFEVLAFCAPLVVVQKKDTGEKGTLYFQHSPRFYFDYKKDE